MILITYLEVTLKNKNNNVFIPVRKDDDGTNNITTIKNIQTNTVEESIH